MSPQAPRATSPLRLPEVVLAQDWPVEKTFIHFNEFSPAMLPSKSTPAARFKGRIGADDADEQLEAAPPKVHEAAAPPPERGAAASSGEESDEACGEKVGRRISCVSNPGGRSVASSYRLEGLSPHHEGAGGLGDFVPRVFADTHRRHTFFHSEEEQIVATVPADDMAPLGRGRLPTIDSLASDSQSQSQPQSQSRGNSISGLRTHTSSGSLLPDAHLHDAQSPRGGLPVSMSEAVPEPSSPPPGLMMRPIPLGAHSMQEVAEPKWQTYGCTEVLHESAHFRPPMLLSPQRRCLSSVDTEMPPTPGSVLKTSSSVPHTPGSALNSAVLYTSSTPRTPASVLKATSSCASHTMSVASTRGAPSVRSMRSVRFEEEVQRDERAPAIQPAKSICRQGRAPSGELPTPMAVPEKNTFIHFGAGEASPAVAKIRTTPVAPMPRLEAQEPLPQVEVSQRRSPMVVPQKNTFIHFDSAQGSPAVAKIKTSPEVSLWGFAPDHADDGGASPAGSLSSRSSWHSADGPGFAHPAAESDTDDVEILAWKGLGLDRCLFLPQQERGAGEDPLRLSRLLACRKAGLKNLGAQLHVRGRCVPCLMQCRWTAGRCQEPCRFGLLCNRCHEPHAEEELQRVQVQMRRLRKHSGTIPRCGRGGGSGGARFG